MTELGLPPFLVLSAFLFVCGVVCVATKRNAIGILMGVELILNAANINLVAAARFVPTLKLEGQVFALLVVVLAAAVLQRQISPAALQMAAAGSPQCRVVRLARSMAVMVMHHGCLGAFQEVLAAALQTLALAAMVAVVH